GGAALGDRRGPRDQGPARLRSAAGRGLRSQDLSSALRVDGAPRQALDDEPAAAAARLAVTRGRTGHPPPARHRPPSIWVVHTGGVISSLGSPPARSGLEGLREQARQRRRRGGDTPWGMV